MGYLRGTAILCRAIACIFFFTLCLGAYAGEKEEKSAGSDVKSPQYEWGKNRTRNIVVWGNGNDLDRPFMKKAFDRYEKLTGNHLLVKRFTHEQLEKELQAGFDGKGPLPDVFLYPSGIRLRAMNPDKNFNDFTNAPWVNDLVDTALSQSISNGRVVGLPFWEASIAGIIYNKKIFDKLNLKVPRNLEEFLHVCSVLLQNGIYPLYLPFAESSMLLYQFPLSAILNDHSTLEDLNEGILSYATLPGMKEIVSWYKMMADKGYLGPDYEKNDWNGMDAAMKSGRYAMMLCWDTWLYSDFSGNPKDFGLMPVFMGVPEDGAYEGPNLMLLIANKNGANLEGAIDLITFMADPYNYNDAFGDFYTAPVFKKQIGSLGTPQYDEAARFIDKHLYESIARPLVYGFSQSDASFIQRFMRDPSYTIEQCIEDMDKARLVRREAIINGRLDGE